jgi:hypothetical protein
MGKVLFISPATIKERTGLHANVDEKLVNPEIITAQDMYIHPALGTGLYTRLQDGIENNNLTAQEQDLLNTYITDALVYYTLSELPMGMSFQFYNKGVIRKTGTDQVEPNVQELIEVANRYRARAEFYANRMMLFVKETASKGQYFQQYINPGNGVDIIHPERQVYASTVYLGHDKHRPRTYEEKYQGDSPNCCD